MATAATIGNQPGSDDATKLAAADLTGDQWRAVKITSKTEVDAAGAGEAAYGILHNAPDQAEVAFVRTSGGGKASVGTGGWTLGDYLTPEADGDLVTATTGDYAIGVALETVAAGEIGMLNIFVDAVPLP